MNTDSLIEFLINSAFVILGIIFLLMLQISMMRFFAYIERRMRDNIVQIWRPLLLRAALGEREKLPRIKGKQWRYIAEEWNNLIGSLRGEARDNLIDFAWEIKLQLYVKKNLFGKGTKNKLFSVVTLGHMRASFVWSDLVRIMNASRAIISLVAAQALIQIDAEKALKIILPQLDDRLDWHWAGIAHIFRIADKDIMCPKLVELIAEAAVEKLPGYLRLIATIDCDMKSSVISDVLKHSHDEQVLSTILHFTKDPDAVSEVRKYIHNSRWHVRMHAATALGRIGKEEDIPLLVSCLQDAEWWVRYRAAQALSAMPFVSLKKLNTILKKQTDKFGKDILQQVISERLDYAE